MSRLSRVWGIGDSRSGGWFFKVTFESVGNNLQHRKLNRCRRWKVHTNRWNVAMFTCPPLRRVSEILQHDRSDCTEWPNSQHKRREHSSARKVEVIQNPHVDSQDGWYRGASSKTNSSIVNTAFGRQFGLRDAAIHKAASEQTREEWSRSTVVQSPPQTF
jgi:hypothetical protein